MRRGEDEFQKKLNEVKRQLNAPFPWYPYDSLGNVGQWEKLFGGKRTILDFARGGEVLDIGCADGAVSFYLERQGCQVEAIDLAETNYNGMQGIRALKEALGSKITIREMDLDRQFTLEKTYGLVLFLGILYHLKNPFYALEMLARHARYCLLSTRVAALTPSGAPMKQEPLAYLLGHDEANGDCTNFWIFSEAGLRRIAHRAGWNVVALHTRGFTGGASNPKDGDRDERAFCLLESRVAAPAVPVALLQGWHAREDSWRWTERRFRVRTGAPLTVKENQLEFHFHHIHSFPVTMRVSVAGHALREMTFSGPGEYVYIATVPDRLLRKQELQLDFELDCALEPSGEDNRERGVIVNFFRSGYPDGDNNLPLRFVQGREAPEAILKT